jgi:hypothetical protein
MNEEKPNDLPSKHCWITVTKDAEGNYVASYFPEVIPVGEHDTVLTFKLDKNTPDDVVIRSVSITPEDQDQLSTPSIAKNGKHVTLSDLNTLKQTFHLDFTFGDKKGGRLAVATRASVMTNLYPEIENDPPG